MKSKQRVRSAIRHAETDRVPIDYYARGEVTAALRKRLGLGAGESLDARLGVDLRGVGPSFKPEALPYAYADPSVEKTHDGVYLDIWGVGFRPNQTDSGFYMDLAYHPLKSLTSMDELEGHSWPTADMWDYSEVADRATENADYWVWAHSRGIFEISWFIRGFDEFMLDLAVAPELAVALMDRVQDYLMARTRCVLEAGNGLIDMVEYNDDVGGQDGLLISPEMFRQFVKPRMATFADMCKSYGAVVRYHCCGGLRPIIDDLVEIGVEVLTPVQTLARGMEPEGLKRDFGDRMTFNGGIDTQRLLPYSTAQGVREETRRLMGLLGAGGGFILGPSHNFQADVPVDNVVAVYEAALGKALT